MFRGLSFFRYFQVSFFVMALWASSTTSCFAQETDSTNTPFFEIDTHAGGSAQETVSTWNAAAYAGISAKYGLWGINNGRIEILAPAGYPFEGVQIRASDEFMLFHLHEFFYRSGTSYGDQTRLMVGIGSDRDLPNKIGKITASIGALIYNAQPNGESVVSMIGAYLGGSVTIKVSKIEGALRVAYYLSPRVAHDGEELTIDDVLRISDFSSWKKGFIGSGEIFYDAFDVNFLGTQLRLGPELKAEFADLPTGTELVMRLGFQGKLRF